MNQPTIFFVIATEPRINFILRTDVFRILKTADYRLVIISPFAERRNFLTEFGGANVFFEPLRPMGRLARFIVNLRNQALELNHPKLREARRIHSRVTRRFQTPPTLERNFTRPLALALVAFLKGREWLWNKLEEWLWGNTYYRELFRRYEPAAIVLASAGAESQDIPFIVWAKRHQIPAVAMDNNIDVFTFRYFSRVRPGVVFALFNGTQREEAVALQDVPAERLLVTGAARYDFALREFVPKPREAFLTKLGLDPGKKLITFGAKIPIMYPESGDIMKILANGIVSGAISHSAQLYVRFDPGHDPGIYRDFFARHPEVRYERAEQASSREHMANLLHASDVVLSIGSTMNVEACLVDTPSIWIGYDGFTKHERIEDSSALVYQLDLFKRLLAAGGIALARNAEETIKLVNTYLADPGQNRAERAALVRMVTNPDGKAGERIARCLLELISKPAAARERF